MSTKDKEIKVKYLVSDEIDACERELERLKVKCAEDPNLSELVREQKEYLQKLIEIKNGDRALPNNTIRTGMDVISIEWAENIIATLEKEKAELIEKWPLSEIEDCIAENDKYIEFLKEQLSNYYATHPSESDDLPEGVFQVGVCTYTVDEAETVIATLEQEKIELLEKWPFSEVEDCIADDDHNIMLLKEGIAKYSATHPSAPH